MTDRKSEAMDRLYRRTLSNDNDVSSGSLYSPESYEPPHHLPMNNHSQQNGGNHIWITNGTRGATSHSMLHQRQPAPLLVKAKYSSQTDNYQQMSRPSHLPTSRRSRHFVPSCRKDEYYWMKRRKNNEAARKSREKRRNNDMILAQNVLALLQENIKLKRDLYAVKMKYNEVEQEEFNEFTRKLESGELLSGLTQNLNLADYGIPEHVIKALSHGMEVNLSQCVSFSNGSKASGSQQSNCDSGKDESIGSSSDDYSRLEMTNSAVHVNRVHDNHQFTYWNKPNDCTGKMNGEEESQADSVITVDPKTWPRSTASVICIPGQNTSEKMSVDGNGDSRHTRMYTHDLVKGAEMLQTFVQYSWQQATNNFNDQAAKGIPNCVPRARSPVLVMPSQWPRHADSTNLSDSTVTDESAMKQQQTTEVEYCSAHHDRRIARDSSSSPQSDDNTNSLRDSSSEYASLSSFYREDWSSKSGDYSSSDSCGSSSHVASPRTSRREESSDTCDSDDKSCRLPYKLRFKLATLHGGQEEQATQN